jgi:hypothetical protein
MNFTIKRSKWLRGEDCWMRGEEDENVSVLLRPSDGKQCCMGQVASQCGVPDEELKLVPTYDELLCDHDFNGQLLSPFVKEDEGFTNEVDWLSQCYSTNDDPGMTDEDRERILTDRFAAHGHTLTFVD